MVSAAWDGDLVEAKMLLEFNPSFAKYSTFGGLNSPLHFAASKGHNEIVALLLEKGADMNSRDYCGQTALMQACRHGHWEVVQTLMLYRCNVMKADYLSGRTALHFAAVSGRVRCIRLVVADFVPSAPYETLHACVDADYPDNPIRQQQKDVKELVQILSRMYPCSECANHFKEVLRSNPVQSGSHAEFSQWLCHVHNVVNRSIGKPISCIEKYKDGLVLPDLRDSVMTALDIYGVRVDLVTPGEVMAGYGWSTEQSPEIPRNKTAILWASYVLPLFKNINTATYQNYMNNRISALSRLAHMPSDASMERPLQRSRQNKCGTFWGPNRIFSQGYIEFYYDTGHAE
ncbi:hypothetical protein KIW84_012873 [Lathyrus oleraceus]|uniref:Sulfhydryl oxidase n=1 Tax=Pisum sativum TaxID=3888 RepID=A0A9D5GXD1_PEA|nr:hypothetical protein KIW84_012873 [Pisum sativum]